jgi:hypothetical protein
MCRFYFDSQYGVSKTEQMLHAVTMNGTQASVAQFGAPLEVMENVTVTDWNVSLTTGGTGTEMAITLGYSLAGTGTFTAIGTMALGTNADNTVVDGAVTATNLSDGDHLIIKSVAGTGADAWISEFANIELKTRFVADQT